jgi:membrane protein implicated in regulation of membrane protease activity
MFALLAGLGILTVALFPIAVPGLLLFVVAPLILVAVPAVLLAIPVVLSLTLLRAFRRGRSRRRVRPADGSAAADPVRRRVGVDPSLRART